MHSGKSYNLREFLWWTKRGLLLPVIAAFTSVLLYYLFDLKWMAIPWTIVALLGTAIALIIGFRNLQTYNRTWEARQIWGAAMSASRAWAIMCRDCVPDKDKARELIYRHFAWITALRYQLRTERSWETVNKTYNKMYQKFYTIPERETPFETELAKYISADEMKKVIGTNNAATQLLGLQSNQLKDLYRGGVIDNFTFLNMHKDLREFPGHQGKSERIKNFPYPRQYTTISNFFVKLFCILLPFAMLGEFDKLGSNFTGFMHYNFVLFVIPFSIVISWVYISLEQVGESTENPFEGGANDVPISQMSRNVEIDIREMLGEDNLPEALKPMNNIIL